MLRYRSEFDLIDVPGVVEGAVFPVLRTIGSLIGRYRTYADAPPPVG
jgi:hypothetical protein